MFWQGGRFAEHIMDRESPGQMAGALSLYPSQYWTDIVFVKTRKEAV
jgi:hypothetical protein